MKIERKRRKKKNELKINEHYFKLIYDRSTYTNTHQKNLSIYLRFVIGK